MPAHVCAHRWSATDRVDEGVIERYVVARRVTACPATGNREPETLVFANRYGKAYLMTSLNHVHTDPCTPKVDSKRRPMFPADFVIHSLRHTILTRLGESGVDAFTIMRIAGQQYRCLSAVHPS